MGRMLSTCRYEDRLHKKYRLSYIPCKPAILESRISCYILHRIQNLDRIRCNKPSLFLHLVLSRTMFTPKLLFQIDKYASKYSLAIHREFHSQATKFSHPVHLALHHKPPPPMARPLVPHHAFLFQI